MPIKRTRWRVCAASVLALVCALTALGCGSSSTGSSSSGASPASGATSQSTQAASASTSLKCGQDVAYSNQSPDHSLQTLPAAVRARYNTWPDAVTRTPWTNAKFPKPPWKLGLIYESPTGPYDVDVIAEAKREFAAAKAKGLVKGNLVTYISPSAETQTPEQQISAVQSMVRQGVNAIMALPIDGTAMGPVVTAAGKAGVPFITIDNFVPNSKYAINVWSDSSSPAFAGMAGQVKKGNILIVRGIAGNTTEAAFYRDALADIKACPQEKVVGTVFGNFNSATAKTAVTSFISSHPGLPINGVAEIGVMGAGVMSAFQSLGKTVPPVADGGCEGGDLSWWLAHKSTYSTTAGCTNGFQVAYDEIRIALRILGGKGLKLNSVPLPTAVVTNANLAEYATPGKSLTWTGEARGPLDALCSESCLDGYFEKPGTPGGI